MTAKSSLTSALSVAFQRSPIHHAWTASGPSTSKKGRLLSTDHAMKIFNFVKPLPVQAIDILANKMQPQCNAAGAIDGIPIGVWKGAADQGGQQLGIEHAKELLQSMQSMLDLKEEGNR